MLYSNLIGIVLSLHTPYICDWHHTMREIKAQICATGAAQRGNTMTVGSHKQHLKSIACEHLGGHFATTNPHKVRQTFTGENLVQPWFPPPTVLLSAPSFSEDIVYG